MSVIAVAVVRHHIVITFQEVYEGEVNMVLLGLWCGVIVKSLLNRKVKQYSN